MQRNPSWSKRQRASLLFTCVAALAVASGASADPAEEFRGVWADIFHAGFKNANQIDQMVALAYNGKYNAIVAEVLGFHDSGGGGAHGAYWNSSIVPQASDISGGIDPLAYLCERAHAHGIEVHAWILPYRASSTWPPPNNAILTAHPEWVMVPYSARGGGPATIGGQYWLDPGSPDVQDYVMSIIREILTRYPVDGINLDYIRYPATDAGYPSSLDYEKSGLKRFQRIQGVSWTPTTSDPTWNNFRRREINELVRRSRAEIAAVKDSPRQPVRFTADVFSQHGAYYVFQDWHLWMSKGWVDGVATMNYENHLCCSSCYASSVNNDLAYRYQRHVYCGQANYLNTMDNSIAQMAYARAQGANGMVNYSYYLTDLVSPECGAGPANNFGWYNHVATNLYTTRVPPPKMIWRDPATATEGTLWGQVIDFATGLPVDDATVLVSGLASEKTDGSGYYTIALIPAGGSGTYKQLSAAKTGYPSAMHPAALVRPGDVMRYDLALGAPPPVIDLSTSSILRTVVYGNPPPTDTFEIAAAAGTGPVNYQIASSAAWLSVWPADGSSQGEADPITVRYDLTGLAPGDYSADITVSDTGASNHPATLAVSLTLCPAYPPGDLNHDYDVDQEDFGRLQECLTGIGVPLSDQACAPANLDGDTDVDEADVAIFITNFSGPSEQENSPCTGL